MTIRFEKGLRFQAALCGSLALLLLASACSQAPPDNRAADEKTIRDLDSKWAAAANASDLEASVSYYTDDAALLPPNTPIANGKEAIRAVWKGLLAPGVSVSWKPSKVEVARSGDLAYLRGVYQVTVKGKPEDTGKLIDVWIKQADGTWKVTADTFNSDLPPAPAPAPAKKNAAKKKRKK